MSGISHLHGPVTSVDGQGDGSSDGRISGDTQWRGPDSGNVFIVLVLYEGPFGQLALAVIWTRVYPGLVLTCYSPGIAPTITAFNNL